MIAEGKRLEAELAKSRCSSCGKNQRSLCAACSEHFEMKAEIERLRESLGRIALWPESTPEEPSITSQDIAMRRFARAALAGVKP